MGENEKEVANNLINTLGVDPCLLAIVIIVIAFFVFLTRSSKEREQVERQRLKDALDAVERIVRDGK